MQMVDDMQFTVLGKQVVPATIFSRSAISVRMKSRISIHIWLGRMFRGYNDVTATSPSFSQVQVVEMYDAPRSIRSIRLLGLTIF